MQLRAPTNHRPAQLTINPPRMLLCAPSSCRSPSQVLSVNPCHHSSLHPQSRAWWRGMSKLGLIQVKTFHHGCAHQVNLFPRNSRIIASHTRLPPTASTQARKRPLIRGALPDEGWAPPGQAWLSSADSAQRGRFENSPLTRWYSQTIRIASEKLRDDPNWRASQLATLVAPKL